MLRINPEKDSPAVRIRTEFDDDGNSTVKDHKVFLENDMVVVVDTDDTNVHDTYCHVTTF